MVAQRADYAAAVAIAVGRITALRTADPWADTRRVDQTPPPGTWRTWAYVSGRGAGKTRAAAEWVRGEVMAGRARRVALVGPTAADARDVMVEGESGLIAVCDRYAFRPRYEPSKRRLTFPNGAIATTFSAEEPDRLRGPEHDLAWSDELAAWARASETWDMLQFGLRIGANPRQVVTTTPRPIPLLRRLLAGTNDGTVAVTRATTFDNAANLAPAFLDQIVRRYEGTRLGRQELAGELLDDVPGALWTLSVIDATRADFPPTELDRIVVGVDPMVGPAGDEPEESGGGSETGIVVAGADADGHGWVLDDASVSGSPRAWAEAVVAAYDRWQADRVVAEANQGGLMVAHTLRTVRPDLPITLVHASRGKRTRAEPVAALYEQGRVHHVGVFPRLEDQLVSYDGTGASPDRLDACVWALTDLLIEAQPAPLTTADLAFFDAVPA